MPKLSANPSLDGEIQQVLQASWTNAHDSLTGVVDKTDTIFRVRGEFNGSLYNCGRGFLVFDLSSIPAGANLFPSDLTIYIETNSVSDADHGELSLFESSQADSNDLATTDYIEYETTVLANTVDGSSGGSKVFTFNSSGLNYIRSKIGTKAAFCIRTKKDINNTQPTGLGWVGIASVDHATSSFRPLLTVNYFNGGAVLAGLL